MSKHFKMTKRTKKKLVTLILTIIVLSVGYLQDQYFDSYDSEYQSGPASPQGNSSAEETPETEFQTDGFDPMGGLTHLDLSEIPAYDGSQEYCVINGNEPWITGNTTEAFEFYSELDSLGRCGPAYANVCQELMPTEKRESISEVKPSGWHNQKYDFVDNGGYVYNRCHLIAFQLCAENATRTNLITGTRQMNVAMIPFENMIADYVKETGNHVLYRVTPIFEEDGHSIVTGTSAGIISNTADSSGNLLPSGVLMEAKSVEDDEICFNVFIYNAQDGVEFDYATGENWAAE